MTVKYKDEKILQDHLWNLQNGQKILVDDRILEAISKARDALEEVKQYREIGTVEECREAVEKQTAKKPIIETNRYTTLLICPSCGRKQGIRYKQYRCIECGQKLDWSDEE